MNYTVYHNSNNVLPKVIHWAWLNSFVKLFKVTNKYNYNQYSYINDLGIYVLKWTFVLSEQIYVYVIQN